MCYAVVWQHVIGMVCVLFAVIAHNTANSTHTFRFLWPCIVSKVWRERKNQQGSTIRCLLLTSVSTCFGHHYAQLQENKDRVTAFGVLLWFCWMWLVAVVGRCVVGCEQCEGYCSTEQRPCYCMWCTALVLLHVVYCSGSAGCGW